MSSLTLNSLVDTFASPYVVFDRIREKSISSWVPLLILLVTTAGVVTLYYMTVDMYQFMEISMKLSGQEIAQADFEQMMQGESIMRIISSASTTVAIIIFYLLLALYFFLAATLVAEERYSFGQLFALICWGSLPGLLSTLSMLITYATSSGFVYVALLDKTSLASILSMTVESAHFDIASAISVGAVWSYVLFGVGFNRITRCSAVTSTIVGVIPPAFQYGLTYIL